MEASSGIYRPNSRYRVHTTTNQLNFFLFPFRFKLLNLIHTKSISA